METGLTELDIRVSFLKRASWIKKAKPRMKKNPFFPRNLWERGSLHSLLPYTHHVGPGQEGVEAGRRKKAIRLSPGSHIPFPAAPCLGAILTLSHLCARPHTYTRTHHTLQVTQSQPGLCSCGPEVGHHPGTAQKSGLGSGGIRVALSVSEQNLHIRRGSGFRS